MTKVEAPFSSAASATLRVPSRLVLIPSSGLLSTNGTCFSAAAWKTTSGLHFLEQLRDPGVVAHIDDAGDEFPKIRMALSQLHVEQVEMKFGTVADGQQVGTEHRDLPAKLGANRSACAGRQHDFAVDRGSQRLEDRSSLRAARAGRPRSIGLGSMRPSLVRSEVSVTLGIREALMTKSRRQFDDFPELLPVWSNGGHDQFTHL